MCVEMFHRLRSWLYRWLYRLARGAVGAGPAPGTQRIASLPSLVEDPCHLTATMRCMSWTHTTRIAEVIQKLVSASHAEGRVLPFL